MVIAALESFAIKPLEAKCLKKSLSRLRLQILNFFEFFEDSWKTAVNKGFLSKWFSTRPMATIFFLHFVWSLETVLKTNGVVIAALKSFVWPLEVKCLKKSLSRLRLQILKFFEFFKDSWKTALVGGFLCLNHLGIIQIHCKWTIIYNSYCKMRINSRNFWHKMFRCSGVVRLWKEWCWMCVMVTCPPRSIVTKANLEIASYTTVRNTLRCCNLFSRASRDMPCSPASISTFQMCSIPGIYWPYDT